MPFALHCRCHLWPSTAGGLRVHARQTTSSSDFLKSTFITLPLMEYDTQVCCCLGFYDGILFLYSVVFDKFVSPIFVITAPLKALQNFIKIFSTS